jgi:hypothetical protein
VVCAVTESGRSGIRNFDGYCRERDTLPWVMEDDGKSSARLGNVSFAMWRGIEVPHHAKRVPEELITDRNCLLACYTSVECSETAQVKKVAKSSTTFH